MLRPAPIDESAILVYPAYSGGFRAESGMRNSRRPRRSAD